MRSAKTLVLLSAIFLFSSFSVAEAKTVAKPISKQYVRLFYCQNAKKAADSFAKNYRSIDVIAPQAYSIDANGTLRGGLDPRIESTAKKHKIRIMPLVVNKGFNSSTAAKFFDDPGLQTIAIDAMVNEALQKGYWGWQVDFEQVDISYRDKFTAFVKSLHDALNKNDLVLSVAVIAQTSTNPEDYPKDYWYKFIGVYDYAGLASNSDFISLMSYDDPGSDGPVTRYTWLTQVIDYALKSVPPEKLSIGIPLYYWRWNETTGKRVGVGTYAQLRDKMRKYYVKKGYDPVEHTAYIKYKTNKMTYTIWYENSKSVEKKVELIKKNGLHGFSAWALGQEAPDVFRSVTTNKYTANADVVITRAD